MKELFLTEELSVSKIVLGTAFFGTYQTVEESFELMDYYVSQGGNTLDTARAYCGWIEGCEYKSEETIGKWLKERNNRDKIKIITKGGHPSFHSETSRSRLKEEDIRYDIELSLKLLMVDYVDLYLLHRDDESIPVGQIMDILHQLVLEGKTKAIGVSNWSVDRIKEANEYAMEHHITPICVSEIQWSLAECFPKTFHDDTLICMDKETYHQYQELGIKVLAYSSQAGGVFSSGYGRDLEGIQGKHQKYLSDENRRRYHNLLTLCEEKNYKASSVALEYIIDNPLDASAIIGCSSLEQLKLSIEAKEHQLSVEEIESLI